MTLEERIELLENRVAALEAKPAAPERKTFHKVLKYEIVLQDGERYIRITEQSHRRMEFGNKGSYDFMHNGFLLSSEYMPDALHYCMFVRGLDDRHDNKLCPIPSDKWLEDFDAAVKAYNEFEFEE